MFLLFQREMRMTSPFIQVADLPEACFLVVFKFGLNNNMKKTLLQIVLLALCISAYAQKVSYATQPWVQLPYPIRSFYDANENRTFKSVIINARAKEYVIVDSLTTVFRGQDQLWFYFLIEKSQEINLVCPEDYAMIVIDKNQRVVLKWFWTAYSTDYEINGNCEPRVARYNTKGVECVFLFLGSSGCGSGTGMQWARMNYENGFLTLKRMGGYGSGYSELILNEVDGTYLIVEKINPECHYDCPSRYKFSKFDLVTNTFIKSKETKYEYDDFSNLNQSDFLKIIKKSEPNAIP